MYGIHPPLLEDVVSFTNTNESKMDRDIGKVLAGGHFSEPLPEGEILWPTESREDPSGLLGASEKNSV